MRIKDGGSSEEDRGREGGNCQFMTQKMKVEFEDGADVKTVMTAVLKACKKVESDCEIFMD